ncbi:MAG: restriction endonuclease [Flavobacteriales bacterium]
MTNILIGILILIILSIIFSYSLNKKSKHKRNIYKSKKIISKINTFEFEGQKLNYLKKIDPFVFEELLLSAFEKKGYKIQRNIKYTGDGGIDGVIYDNNNNKFLIQAKRYSNYINKAHVKDFGDLLKSKNCKGFFIHTGKTGKGSFDESLNYNMKIISGNKLLSLIELTRD